MSSTETQQSAQSAREVVAKHLEALEEWFYPDSPEEVERNVERRKEARDVCRTALALRALLAQPPSDTVARLVEAAGEVADSLQSTKQHIARAGAIAVPEDADVKRLCALHGYGAIMDAAARAWALKDPVGSFVVGPCAGVILPELTALEAAIAAHRASVDALGAGRGDMEIPGAPLPNRGVAPGLYRVIRATLESTRDVLGARPVEHVVDAAKRVMAELDEVRQKAARDREGDRRMLKNRDEDYEQAAAERDALKAEVERLRADPIRMASAIPEPSGAPTFAPSDPPSHAPLDPRALWIADKTWDMQMRFLRVETREDGKSGWSTGDASEFVAFAAETLRVAEAEARKGVGK